MFSNAITTIVAFAAVAAAVPDASPAEAGLEKRAYNGDATYYYQNGNAGSCGKKHSDGEWVAALAPKWQGNNQKCGQYITVTNQGGGQNNNGKGTTIRVLVADECPECDPNHVDFSTGAFKKLTGGSLDPPGEFKISWYFS